MKKENEARDPRSTWNKTPSDEPVFILRAQDILAPSFVEHWANMAECVGSPKHKILEARHLACEMDAYRMAHDQEGKVPD